ncbi:hypothetical protein C8Q76DRAFT_163660 [Earliella scabrosa]|nr:hypothetical protein C8Q76DRAFT_163660 [Earliella scabrosa]
MRSFSLVLLRRLVPPPPTVSLSTTVSTRPPSRPSSTSFSHEPSAVVRRKTVDTAIDLSRHQALPSTLQPQVFAPTRGRLQRLRIDLDTNGVVSILQKGLQDLQRIEVCLAFLRAPSFSVVSMPSRPHAARSSTHSETPNAQYSSILTRASAPSPPNLRP